MGGGLPTLDHHQLVHQAVRVSRTCKQPIGASGSQLQAPSSHLKDAVCDAAVCEWHPHGEAVQLALEFREDECDGCSTACAGRGQVDQTRPGFFGGDAGCGVRGRRGLEGRRQQGATRQGQVSVMETPPCSLAPLVTRHIHTGSPHVAKSILGYHFAAHTPPFRPLPHTSRPTYTRMQAAPPHPPSHPHTPGPAQVTLLCVGCIHKGLCVGEVVDGGDAAVSNAKLLMNHLQG